MTREIFFREFMAVSQNGTGFNYWVEVGLRLDQQTDEARSLEAIKAVLSRLDHKALGVDVNLGFEPTSEALCRWIYSETEKLLPQITEVRLLRGDGAIMVCNSN